MPSTRTHLDNGVLRQGAEVPKADKELSEVDRVLAREINGSEHLEVEGAPLQVELLKELFDTNVPAAVVIHTLEDGP